MCGVATLVKKSIKAPLSVTHLVRSSVTREINASRDPAIILEVRGHRTVHETVIVFSGAVEEIKSQLGITVTNSETVKAQPPACDGFRKWEVWIDLSGDVSHDREK